MSSDVYCYSFEVFEGLSDLGYVPSSLYSPMQSPKETYTFGGDCKALSGLYVRMVRSLGFDARLVCRYSERHCIAVVPNDDGFFVVDLTVPGFYLLSEGMDVWDYYEEGERVYNSDVLWRVER